MLTGLISGLLLLFETVRSYRPLVLFYIHLEICPQSTSNTGCLDIPHKISPQATSNTGCLNIPLKISPQATSNTGCLNIPFEIGPQATSIIACLNISLKISPQATMLVIEHQYVEFQGFKNETKF